jgi:SAM-dependent methyltransferase
MAEAAQVRDLAKRHNYVFDSGLSSPDFFNLEKRMASEEFALLHSIEPHWNVMEIGCLTGLNLLGLAERGHTGWLHGLDFVDGAVQWFREKANQRRNIAGFCAEFPPLPFGLLYDVVICFDVLEHQQNVGAFLAGVAAALAPGGRAMILVPAGRSFYDCGHVAFFPDEECLRNVLDYYLEVESVQRLKSCDKMFATCTRRK